MRTMSKHVFSFFLLPIIFCMCQLALGSRDNIDDLNSGSLIELGAETKKADCLAESVYWPEFDYKNVKQYIAEPNSKKKSDFVRIVSQILEPNYLSQDLAEKTIFLKGWRGEDNENFIIQYEKQPYLIRIKNQTTTVIASRKWTSHWLTMVIQLKDKSSCVNKNDLDAIFNFTDKFLSKKVNSTAQNYLGMKNVDGTDMVKPIFKQLDNGYYLVYPVQTSHPDIDGVIIWTDGHTVIINLQERRKVIIN